MLNIGKDSGSQPIQALLLALNHPLEMQLCPIAPGSSAVKLQEEPVTHSSMPSY